jgi:hypothetical protein
MSDALIGGAIAAVIGALAYGGVALCQERGREKARRLAIVEALLTEAVENLTICGSPKMREMWWLSPFKLDAYHAYKGQILFLPRAILTHLIAAALLMEGENVVIQIQQSREVYVEALDRIPKPIPDYLTKQLEFVKDELTKWREEHIR